VQQLQRSELRRAFGDSLGPHLFVLAHGLDPREVEPERQAKSIGHELTFAEDLRTPDEVHGVLLQLAEMVGRRLRREGVRGGVVRLKLRYGDFTTLVRQRKVAPTDDDQEIAPASRELLAAAWERARGVRLLGITAAQLAGGCRTGAGRSLFAPHRKQRDRLLRAMDAIRDRHGEDKLRHGGGERRTTTPFGGLGVGLRRTVSAIAVRMRSTRPSRSTRLRFFVTFSRRSSCRCAAAELLGEAVEQRFVHRIEHHALLAAGEAAAPRRTGDVDGHAARERLGERGRRSRSAQAHAAPAGRRGSGRCRR
jgi:hypothetical protein